MVAVALIVGVALSWLNAAQGLLVRDVETTDVVSVFAVVILVATSSVLVPVDTMPDWLQTFGEVNPISVTVDALRALILGPQAVANALIWIAALLVVSVPLALVRYRRLSP